MNILKRFVVAVGFSRILCWILIIFDVWFYQRAISVVGFSEATLIMGPILMLEVVIGFTIYLLFIHDR